MSLLSILIKIFAFFNKNDENQENRFITFNN